MTLLFIGTTEIIVIGAVALLLFGGKKLPELMRGLGKGVREFKDGVNGMGEQTPDNPNESENSDESDDLKQQKADNK